MFQLKEIAISIFRPKSNVPFSTLDTLNKELDNLENMRVIYKIDYSDWVYAKKKIRKIR